jgi:hypothetical protein
MDLRSTHTDENRRGRVIFDGAKFGALLRQTESKDLQFGASA